LLRELPRTDPHQTFQLTHTNVEVVVGFCISIRLKTKIMKKITERNVSTVNRPPPTSRLLSNYETGTLCIHTYKHTYTHPHIQTDRQT
jgi:hypothetical protein